MFKLAIEQFSAPGQHWLDAGCGTGQFAAFLGTLGHRVTAIDASSEMVRLCQVPAIVASVEQLPFPDATFDGILCSSVLEYLDSPSVALTEFRRVLKPNGCLLVSVPNSHSLVRGLQRLTYSITRHPEYMKFSRHSFTAKEFDALLSAHGFTPQQNHSFGSKLPGESSLPFGYTLRLHVACAR